MPPIRARSRSRFAVLLVALGLAACGDDDPLRPEDVDREDVVGTYDATTLTVTEGSLSINFLLLGADAEVTLAADGTTQGRLVIPEPEGGEDLDEDLAGTYTFDEHTREVEFEQEADTFLRDLTLVAVRTAAGIELQGGATFDGTRVELVLRRR